jgi:hypothetical protein
VNAADVLVTGAVAQIKGIIRPRVGRGADATPTANNLTLPIGADTVGVNAGMFTRMEPGGVASNESHVIAGPYHLVALGEIEPQTGGATPGAFEYLAFTGPTPAGMMRSFVINRATGNRVEVAPNPTTEHSHIGKATTSDLAGQTQVCGSVATATGMAYLVVAEVIARRNDDGAAYGYVITGTFKNNGGVVANPGGVSRTHVGEDAAGADATFKINSTIIPLQVTGIATETTNWRSRIRVIEVS